MKKQILFEKSPYYVIKEKNYLKVFKDGHTHATICATVGIKPDYNKALAKCIELINNRLRIFR